MPKKIDETGHQYKNFTVIGLDLENTTQRKKWLCQCNKCKEIISIYGTALRQNKIPECKNCQNNSLNGNVFGKLKVLNYSHTEQDRHKFYKCQCACGNIETIRGTDLITNKRFQCLECNKKERKKQFIDETGKQFGKLTVIKKYNHPTDKKNAWWTCQCECGNTIQVLGIKLRIGHTQSCGCLKSKGEELINKILSENNINYKTQITFKDCKNKGLLKFDFGIYDNKNNLLYLIEYDGEQHFKPIKFFGGDENFLKQKERDLIKDNYCLNNKIPLLRIPYTKLETLTIKDLILIEDNNGKKI